MQSSNEIIQNIEQAKGAQKALRTWNKPQAKIAEVAQVTLASNTTFNLSDLGTCAS
ncbi:hypothetical protein [Terriglobus saanensis]|uniref:Uncharacterized protein n=1 Tax=Terriglobus saanensis (strain ATCC BAA-1853 / DSM 23119 / SP1PR4) TaxID=401053 RepID=E8UZV5_TERSS|nr:hypothetical protein [Terriglobus saanensis]ADV81032.1 hypothetical protein AciPR4_0194 [Terriglobus saanensis SP1PR4]